MERLDTNIIAQICAMTDDDTIYNFACSSKTYNNLVQLSKERIEFQRNACPNYELNSLNNTNNVFVDTHDELKNNTIYNAIHNFACDNTIYNFVYSKLFLNTTVLKSYCNSSLECHVEKDCFCSSNEQAQGLLVVACDGKNDILKSLKVKGDITNISLQFSASNTFYDNLSNAFLSSLPTDEHGYKEVFSHFIDSLYFKLFRFCDFIMRITYVGTIEVVKTYMNFEHYHRHLFQDLLRQRAIEKNTFYTLVVLPHMLVSNAPIGTKYINTYQVQPAYISKGFAIIVKDGQGALQYPSDVVKSVEINLFGTDTTTTSTIKEAPTRSYKVSSRRILSKNMIDNPLYNLQFPLQNCLYVPLDKINFGLVHDTEIKIHLHNQYPKDMWSVDIVYFGINYIIYLYGYGLRLC